MDVSSVASTLASVNTPAPARAQEVVEGNQADGDGDRDDAVSSVASTQPSTASNGVVGSQLDVTA